MVQLYKGRMNTLLDFLDWTDFIFNDQVHFEEDVKAKHLVPDMRREFDFLAERLKPIVILMLNQQKKPFVRLLPN
jgi:hypothetical protein